MEESTAYLIQPTVHDKGVVRAWEETIMLPTYAIGKEEKNPIFLEKRVYQGSSGAVYPYAVIEQVSDEKTDRPYKALFLENEYLKVMILPELGGRIQMAYDKVKQRHFVYYNQVIKPALVGLTGPWISGGIEFNWPQHHRPSTFLPTEFLIEEHTDGSKTIWCSEVERMSRTKGMHGFTLYPDKAYIEIHVKIYNRTPFPQTFLWWANPAVAVNDHYHSVFPPDVHAVFDHGKRDVSNFPIATGIYYKQDYSAGVDISKYKNIPVPTSYMAVQSAYDFVGGYEADTKGGLLHVADHHVSPGKKQWTWGCGDFGQAWDRNLTDEDGPYIELMTGVYTDNQPDFSWLQPGEEKAWTQYFMPYAEVGYVKNATKEAMVNVEVLAGEATVILYTTAACQQLHIVLKGSQGQVFLDTQADTSPAHVYSETVSVGQLAAEDLMFELYHADGRLMLTFQAEKPALKPVPEPAKAARDPKEIASIEQLFLTGQHLEQYRHATYHPMDYYCEALRREPGDMRCNNAMGLLLLRKGQFAKAESFFRTAIATQTERNSNPYDGEPYYNLGWSLRLQGKMDEAYDAFYKSTWNAAWQDAGYLALAQIDAAKQQWEQSLAHIERSLIRNWHNHKARHLKAVILRRLGRQEEALQWIDDSLKIDRFNYGCLFEKQQAIALPPHTAIEYAIDFAYAGLYAEAIVLLTRSVDLSLHNSPMLHYYLAYFQTKMGDPEAASLQYTQAFLLSPDGCFPNRIEDVVVLQEAIKQHPQDNKAYYYLGNFWYASRQYEEAVACWEESRRLNDQFPTVQRNLALAYYNKLDRKSEARELLETAFALDTSDARLLMELDQLYKKTGVDPEVRLNILNTHAELVKQRDDLCVERITLCNQLGRYTEAMALIASRRFHPWEGGEGKITKQFTLALREMAKQALSDQDYRLALELLLQADHYPHNLGEGKLANAEANDIDYYKGWAYRGLGDEAQAVQYLMKATQGSSEPQQAFFYNDPQPDNIYYQGLAWEALGNRDAAHSRYNKLIDHGKKHLFDHCRIDYFAVSLPDLAIWEDDLSVRNQIHCYYVMGLGYAGLGNDEQAKACLEQVRQLDVNHIESMIVMKNLK